MRWLVGLLAIVMLAGCSDGQPGAPLKIGDPAPAFLTRAVDGTPRTFPASFAGKPLAISFWADWCKHCASEMRAVEGVYQRHRGKGLEIVAINVGQDTPRIAAYLRKIGVSYPVLLDEDMAITRNYRVLGLPTTYFVDGRGIIRGKIIGEADAATFERHLLALTE